MNFMESLESVLDSEEFILYPQLDYLVPVIGIVRSQDDFYGSFISLLQDDNSRTKPILNLLKLSGEIFYTSLSAGVLSAGINYFSNL